MLEGKNTSAVSTNPSAISQTRLQRDILKGTETWRLDW